MTVDERVVRSCAVLGERWARLHTLPTRCTHSGQIQKFLLRERLAAGHGAMVGLADN